MPEPQPTLWIARGNANEPIEGDQDSEPREFEYRGVHVRDSEALYQLKMVIEGKGYSVREYTKLSYRLPDGLTFRDVPGFPKKYQ
jgi:hypothetical protein